MPRTAFAARGICGFGLCGRAAWEPLHRFQSTRPVWDATRAATASSASPSNFNPRAPCGARPDDAEMRRYIEKFQSTRPVWGATLPQPLKAFIVEISIHAPRVGRDAPAAAQGFHCRNFNPRAPCGARHIAAAPDHKHTQFQSTRPVWGATCCILRRHSLAPNFNPRAPCGTRRDRRAARCALHRISIHAPRVGRDALAPGVFTEGYISIHAPRVGRDLPSGGTAGQALTFQSTRPVWDATTLIGKRRSRFAFQSTRPVWDATVRRRLPAAGDKFQSTRPVWDATRS